MSDGRGARQPTELIYVPRPSWAPVLLALGVALILIGRFEATFYSIAGGVVGGLLVIGALWTWIRSVAIDLGRLPRQLRTSSAVLPAIPLRRDSGE